MKVQHLIFLALALAVSVTAKIEEDNPQQLVQTESTTLEETKEEITELDVANETKPSSPCFYVDVDLMCFNKTSESEKPTCECQQYPEIPTAIVCCNVTDIQKSINCLRTNLSLYTAIHVINAQQQEINLTSINSLKHITSLTFSDGNITRITGSFPRFSSFKCLNFSNNNISDFNVRALASLSPPVILDVSFNNLTRLPHTSAQTQVNIQGNVKIACNNVSAALERGVEFMYKVESMCEFPTDYNWFRSTAAVSIKDLEDLRQLNNDCLRANPGNCNCEPEKSQYLDVGSEQDRIGMAAKVDCSGLGLTNFPTNLPRNTITLIISNNSITSLQTFLGEEEYHGVRNLFADNNLITSLDGLDGSTFLGNFTQLSLRNNRIKLLPHYFLLKLEKSLSGKQVYLGGNRFSCDCQTIKSRKLLNMISDYDKIRCDNMPGAITELSESLLCKSGHHDWASYIDYIIIVEVILLVSLITKVSYDYYVFKNSGFLPLPARWIIMYNQKK